MANTVIDLTDPHCGRCGVLLGVFVYEGDRSRLRCEECARVEAAAADAAEAEHARAR